MADTKLTALQQDFMRQLFGPAQGNLARAAKALSMDDYSILMNDTMVEAIKKRADDEISLNIPRAVYVISKMMNEEDGGLYINDKLHKICMDVLDRAGISKQERPNSGSTTVGLIFLPNKQPLPEPPVLIENGIQTQIV